MFHSFGHGLNISLRGAPEQQVSPCNNVGSVALYGADYPGVRPEVLVAEGDMIQCGEPVFRDRHRPEICMTAPVSGQIDKIEIGARRRLTSVVIKSDGAQPLVFARPDSLTRDSLQALMLETGLWPALTERPFGKIPDPGSAPDALFVTAMQTEPLSADARIVLAQAPEAFAQGIAALKCLTDGAVFVCQGRGDDLADVDDQVQIERFSGPHPAGLPGTHIDRLFPLKQGRVVWQIDYQTVLALGVVLATGSLPETQVIALAGPGVAKPRLIRAPAGVRLDDLLAGELTAGQKSVLSGSVLSGRQSAFLRRKHWQVSVIDRAQPKPTRVRSWLPIHSAAERPRPVIPTQALARALGPKLPVVPLFRALSVGDVETAEKLGARGLLEEDLALASYAAGGDVDLGALLRRALDVIEAQA